MSDLIRTKRSHLLLQMRSVSGSEKKEEESGVSDRETHFHTILKRRHSVVNCSWYCDVYLFLTLTGVTFSFENDNMKGRGKFWQFNRTVFKNIIILTHTVQVAAISSLALICQFLPIPFINYITVMCTHTHLHVISVQL